MWFVATSAVIALSGGTLDLRTPLPRLGLQLLLLAVTAAYFVASWTRGGQTIGMRPWRLRVVAAGGGALSARQAWLRFGVALVSAAAAGCGYWWALFDAQRRTWHDLAAGTLVVRLEKTPGPVRP
jgi:uncharacterized RDD family membrane protein YckC